MNLSDFAKVADCVRLEVGRAPIPWSTSIHGIKLESSTLFVACPPVRVCVVVSRYIESTPVGRKSCALLELYLVDENGHRISQAQNIVTKDPDRAQCWALHNARTLISIYASSMRIEATAILTAAEQLLSTLPAEYTT